MEKILRVVLMTMMTMMTWKVLRAAMRAQKTLAQMLQKGKQQGRPWAAFTARDEERLENLDRKLFQLAANHCNCERAQSHFESNTSLFCNGSIDSCGHYVSSQRGDAS